MANLRRETQIGLLVGLGMAALYCAYVTGLYLLRGSAPFDTHGVSLGAVVATYVGAGVACGLLYGVLHPLGRSLLGSAGLGVVCATALFFGIAVASDGLPTTWSADRWERTAWCGLLFGVVAGPVARHKLR